MPTIDLFDHLNILKASRAATPAHRPGWQARRLTPPDTHPAMWVLWDPAVVVVALLVDDDASIATVLDAAGFSLIDRCPAGSIWAAPVRALASENV